MNKDVQKRLFHLMFDLVCVAAIIGYALYVLFTAAPTNKQLTTLIGLNAILACHQFIIAKTSYLALIDNKNIKEMFGLMETQTLIMRTQEKILTEQKASNEQNTKLIVSQAELLSRLTSSLVKGKAEITSIPGALPKAPTVLLPRLTTSEVQAIETPPATILSAEQYAQFVENSKPKEPSSG
jgi:hypothetical protein